MSEVSSTVEVGADGETVPLMELLTGRGFITGKSGSGKSNTASVFAEELLEEGLPLLIVDTDGEYYGLKAEYEMLQIGPGSDCDVQLGPDRARDIAELAVVENVPIILDVSGFVEQEDAELLVDSVLKQIFALENEWEKPFLVLVEELHEFVPEQQSMPDVGETIIRVAKRGRKRGLGICGMSQRPAAVDKDYITQCNWLIWHRLTWNNDTQVVDRIMGGDAATTVQTLDDGEALVLTDWDDTTRRLQFRRKRTFDAGSTPTLSDAERPSLKTVDQSLIEKLEAKESTTTERTLPEEDEVDSGEPKTPDTEVIDLDEETADDETEEEPDEEPAEEEGMDDSPSPPTNPDGGLLWELGQLLWYLLASTGKTFRKGPSLVWSLLARLATALREWAVSLSTRAADAGERVVAWVSGEGERPSRLRYNESDNGFDSERPRVLLVAIGLVLLVALAFLALAL